jgi:hypothetical protein
VPSQSKAKANSKTKAAQEEVQGAGRRAQGAGGAGRRAQEAQAQRRKAVRVRGAAGR